MQKKQSANEERIRGRICKLCDRKFIIKDMIQGSSKKIKAQNLAIDSST